MSFFLGVKALKFVISTALIATGAPVPVWASLLL